MNNKKFGGVNGKGYYIALILCAAAIGITGYLYYANSGKGASPEEGANAQVSATQAPEKDLQVVATQPQTYEPAQPSQPTEPSKTVTQKPMKTVAPLEGEVIGVYAMDSLSYNATTRDWRVHNGMDLAAQEGAAVRAAADGTVYTVYEDETMGHTVVIRHDGGYVTTYASLAQEASVKPGQRVTAGQTIGVAGTSAILESAIGCHVHFAVSRNDEPVNPADFLAQG